MRQLAMVRRVLARRPWIYWTIVAAVAAAGAIATASVLRGVDDERARWGDTEIVLVATRDVAAGESLARLIAERRYPVAMIPPGAVESLEVGAAARHRLAAGEIVVDVDVAATTAPRSLIPPGWLGVAVVETVGLRRHRRRPRRRRVRRCPARRRRAGRGARRRASPSLPSPPTRRRPWPPRQARPAACRCCSVRDQPRSTRSGWSTPAIAQRQPAAATINTNTPKATR